MSGRYIALYDGQCEICRASIGWVRFLDRDGIVDCVPLESVELAELHPELSLEECLRQLHVVTPEHTVLRGWDAVVGIAGVFPATRAVTTVDRVPGVHRLGERAYEFVAAHRYQLGKFRAVVLGYVDRFRWTGVTRSSRATRRLPTC